MPQPTISGVPPVFKFGNAALPNGQGTMTNLNLNDGTKWQWQRFKGDDDYVQLSVGQLAWRAASVILGRDRKGRTLSEPMRYLEASSSASDAFGVQLALMEQAGLQQVTFDGATYIQAEFSGFKSRDMVTLKAAPYYWMGNLEFFCPTPYFNDLSATTYMNAVALTSGAATNTNVTYLGSVRANPIFTLTIPLTNAVPIQSFALVNSMSTESLTIAFPGNLAASTAWTITIDSGAMTVTDQNGKSYDVAGNAFPLLYGPAGQVQQISATLTPASGTATGCTLSCSATNRWLI